ncbi:MAG: VWA domain-containing protein [Planctomycetaceae bacterium]|jgi:Ca-activated chloride channel family protein|nr:VWA domain-containing protein [Planctomycetaceae bacterium]
MQAFNNIITSCPKWFVLALTAGVGCFVTALLFGEPFLYFTHKDIPPLPPVLPQSVCLTIDISGSMSGRKLDEVKRAAKNFIARRDMTIDKIALVSFSSADGGFFGIGKKMGATINVAFTQNAQQAVTAIDSLSDGGRTDFEAAMQTSEKVLNTVSGEKVILLFTDGQSSAGNPNNAKNIAANLRSQGVRIFAIGTNDADSWFLSSLTGNSKQVIGTSEGQFETAFAQAEIMIYSKGLMDSSGAYSFKETLVRVCIWTAFLCFGIALFIKLIQNRLMQKKKIIRPQNIIAILIATTIVGVIAGGCGQILFGIFSYFGLPYADRIIAWALLGGGSAYGLAFFIPNLNKNWVWKSGATGGALGACAFIYLTQILSDISGRLTGTFILGFFVGLMVGMIESVCRTAFLKINFSGNESTTLNLGETIVSLGSGRSDTVYVSGVIENAMTFHLRQLLKTFPFLF